LFWDIEVTPEEEDELIGKVAEKIHQYGMEVAAILMLESVKPLTWVGSQMGRFFLSPFLPALGETVSMGGEKIFQVFEKHENVEKLIVKLEELANEEKEKPKAKAVDSEALAKEAESEEAPKKKGWRRFLPF
jgi:ABC-type Zn2+ transport system substrate-binding protein/surface adhesin